MTAILDRDERRGIENAPRLRYWTMIEVVAPPVAHPEGRLRSCSVPPAQ